MSTDSTYARVRTSASPSIPAMYVDIYFLCVCVCGTFGDPAVVRWTPLLRRPELSLDPGKWRPPREDLGKENEVELCTQLQLGRSHNPSEAPSWMHTHRRHYLRNPCLGLAIMRTH